MGPGYRQGLFREAKVRMPFEFCVVSCDPSVLGITAWDIVLIFGATAVLCTGNRITAWKNKPTGKPTTFMMTTKFLSILVLKVEEKRQLARPLNTVQLEYLKALKVDPIAFTSPKKGLKFMTIGLKGCGKRC